MTEVEAEQGATSAREPTREREGAAEEWTVARVLRWATDDFRRRGLDSPRLDAELLLARVLGVERVRLIMDSERALAPRELSAFRELIQRRRRAEPIAYILGAREFFGLVFQVDRRVLVPRPDTETLVEVALRRTENAHLQGEALDLCTGSGCVALAFGTRRPTWSILGSDISPDAIAVARENAARLGGVQNTRFLVSDTDAALPNGARFDLVTANPPYIPSGDIAALGPDVRDHEPRLALDGGADGLAVVRRVLTAAHRRLRAEGLVALEIGHDQAARTAALLENAGFTDVERAKDYGGIERVVSGRLARAQAAR
ncbi:MAG TPA: peptide chain release factor N(5)-glutamine methyltransferase [Polyangiaceae bacterium]